MIVILSMLLTCYPLAELIKYNVSLFLAIKVSQKAQRRNDSYRRLTKKKLLCHRMGISALKVPGHRLYRLISYLFYPPGAFWSSLLQYQLRWKRGVLGFWNAEHWGVGHLQEVLLTLPSAGLSPPLWIPPLLLCKGTKSGPLSLI